MTTDNNNTDTQPEEAPVWEMPDHTQTAEALDEMFADMEEELEAADAQDEQDWRTTVRDHS